MNYQRNSVTGRLGFTPVQTPPKLGAAVEEPAITYLAGTTFPKEEGAGRMSSVPEALLQKMKIFQKQNNVPIHLKGGPVDKVLFGSTLILCAVGVAGCFRFFYEIKNTRHSTGIFKHARTVVFQALKHDMQYGKINTAGILIQTHKIEK
ncbi:hypothetical protein Pmani_027389 [Petrolisthes manimaculis]|uniref:Uncharacterized protein n=1 Tax=Petrolisthes manimaculis TaxID=1843537 RepID=A0AAE1P3U7_9EUCA|nr:hypothetical protein Pmani_027389 [Petrolisthes manimaculis]